MFYFVWKVQRLFATLFSTRAFYPPVVNMYPTSPCYESIVESRVLQERGKKSENETESSPSLYCVRLPLLPHLTLIALILQSVPGAGRYCILSLEGRSPRGAPGRFYWMWHSHPARPSIFRPIPFVRTEKGFKWLQYPLVLTPGIGKTFLCPRSCLIFSASLTPSLARNKFYCQLACYFTNYFYLCKIVAIFTACWK